jgi:hypothetical protein
VNNHLILIYGSNIDGMPTYTFKVDLLNSEPLVTRTFKVSSETTLYLMHHIIQVIMGWKNYHLYEFSINNLLFADIRLVDEEFGDFTDVKAIQLEDVFSKTGTKATYLYDFGDGWKHQLELIEISNEPQNELLPAFISGQNTCPPEDCGGVYRYREIIEILADPSHEEYESIKEWLGPKINPIKLNSHSITKELGSLGAKIKIYEKGFN